jgi:hypothetical protein
MHGIKAEVTEALSPIKLDTPFPIRNHKRAPEYRYESSLLLLSEVQVQQHHPEIVEYPVLGYYPRIKWHFLPSPPV